MYIILGYYIYILYLLIIISCQTELQVNLEQRQEQTLQTLTLHIMEAIINVNKTGFTPVKIKIQNVQIAKSSSSYIGKF